MNKTTLCKEKAVTTRNSDHLKKTLLTRKYFYCTTLKRVFQPQMSKKAITAPKRPFYIKGHCSLRISKNQNLRLLKGVLTPLSEFTS